jgi:type IV pilus assembly protein PilB
MFESHDEAISELLKHQGLVRLSDIEALKQRAISSRRSLADTLIGEHVLDPDSLLRAVAASLQREHVSDLPDRLPPELVERIPAQVARSLGVVPLRCGESGLTVAAIDPFRSDLAQDLAFLLGGPVAWVVAPPDAVSRLLRRHYSGPTAGSDPNDPVAEPAFPAASEKNYSAADLESMSEQAPVIRFVNVVLAQAVRDRASDVHFEPFENEFSIRCRVDGVLRPLAPPPRSLALPVASRLKLLANLDIAERRRPQDGRIRTSLGGRTVDLRVSTLPTQFGESIVLRVLDQSAVQLDLDQLGMRPELREAVRTAIRRPHGIFLVVGPTSSGKTTTLYSGLREINAVGTKVLTAEDPVEYEIEGIMQVPVNPGIGLTFASAMRAFLRQDPDVIMLGEIRDHETAQIATQAALTGHLVLSTLHTNDAPSTVSRLLDLGIEPFLVASTLEAVLAQRLVRRICPHCRAAVEPPPELIAQAGLGAGDHSGRSFFHGRGCAACAGTGYRGRQGIYEWMPMSDALRELVASRAPVMDLRRQARVEGLRSLREDGLRAVFAGETTLDEVLKST